eukprot:scaffold735_cov255-Pinguiococcus_pyrenoidosus.AAC.29
MYYEKKKKRNSTFCRLRRLADPAWLERAVVAATPPTSQNCREAVLCSFVTAEQDILFPTTARPHALSNAKNGERHQNDFLGQPRRILPPLLIHKLHRKLYVAW